MPSDKFAGRPERTVRNFLISLSGARPDILKHVPSERTAFEVRGAAVLASAAVFAVATAQFLITAANVSWTAAIVAGAAVGLVIGAIERFPAPKPASWGARLLALIPRVLFATVLGVLLAQLALIAFFRPEVNDQLALMTQQRQSDFTAAQASSPLGKDIKALEIRLDSLQRVIDTGGGAAVNPQDDPTVKTLQQEITLARQLEAADYARWQCQLYGTSPGGGKCAPGVGPVAKADETSYINDVSEIHSLEHRLANRVSQLAAQGDAGSRARVEFARQQLPGVQAELARDQALSRTQAAAFTAANRADNGLLTRIEALDEVSSRYGVVRASVILVTLLFIMLAALPALIGVLQPSRSYERALVAVRRQEAVRAHYRLHSDGEAALLAEALDREGGARLVSAPPPRADDEAADKALRAMRDMRKGGGPA
jgi:hypothetical protein